MDNKITGWQAKSDTLKKLEVIYNEPSDSGPRDVFDRFWESLQTLMMCLR